MYPQPSHYTSSALWMMTMKKKEEKKKNKYKEEKKKNAFENKEDRLQSLNLSLDYPVISLNTSSFVIV